MQLRSCRPGCCISRRVSGLAAGADAGGCPGGSEEHAAQCRIKCRRSERQEAERKQSSTAASAGAAPKKQRKGKGRCDAAGVLMLPQDVQRGSSPAAARSANSSAGRSANTGDCSAAPARLFPARSRRCTTGCRPWRRVIGRGGICESMRAVWKLFFLIKKTNRTS